MWNVGDLDTEPLVRALDGWATGHQREAFSCLADWLPRLTLRLPNAAPEALASLEHALDELLAELELLAHERGLDLPAQTPTSGTAAERVFALLTAAAATLKHLSTRPEFPL